MIIHAPWADDLCIAPELAILAVLEATLAAAIEMMTASHPETFTEIVPAEEFGLDAQTAVVLSRQAAELIATVNRYRLAIFDPDLFPAWSTSTHR
jgi:hypothetical protein